MGGYVIIGLTQLEEPPPVGQYPGTGTTLHTGAERVVQHLINILENKKNLNHQPVQKSISIGSHYFKNFKLALVL